MLTSEQRFTAALAALAAALGELRRPWMLIGGLAVIARGYLRHTDDMLEGPERLLPFEALVRRALTPGE